MTTNDDQSLKTLAAQKKGGQDADASGISTVRAMPTDEELRLFAVSGNMGVMGGRGEYSGLVYLSDLRKYTRLAELRARRDEVETLHAYSSDVVEIWLQLERRRAELDRQIKEEEKRVG